MDHLFGLVSYYILFNHYHLQSYIYEVGKSEKNQISPILKTYLQSNAVVEQITFMKYLCNFNNPFRKFTALLWSQPDFADMVTFVEQSKPKIILSATVNRIYLNVF